jgi:hypothetical protein
MKGWLALLIILGIWLAYKKDKTFGAVVAATNKAKPRKQGVQGTLNPSYGRTGTIATSGSASPGSGVPARQPSLISSWSHGSSGVGFGYTGVTFGKPAQRTRATE